MSKFKTFTLRFFDELEKEVRKLEKKDPDNALILRRILSLSIHTAQLEFALEDILEELEKRPFLNLKPETMLLANMAVQHAKIWPPERITR